MAERKEKSARVQAVEKYDKKTARPMSLKFNSKTDARLLAYMKGMDKKQKYIKKLILDDLKKYEAGEDSIAGKEFSGDIERIIKELAKDGVINESDAKSF